MAENSDVIKLDLFKIGTSVFFDGERVDLTQEFAAEIVENFSTLSKEGVEVPMLIEHERNGRSFGQVIDVFIEDGFVSGSVRLGSDELVAAFERGEIKQASPGWFMEFEHPHTGLQMGAVLVEVSLTSLPHQINLRSATEINDDVALAASSQYVLYFAQEVPLMAATVEEIQDAVRLRVGEDLSMLEEVVDTLVEETGLEDVEILAILNGEAEPEDSALAALADALDLEETEDREEPEMDDETQVEQEETIEASSLSEADVDRIAAAVHQKMNAPVDEAVEIAHMKERIASLEADKIRLELKEAGITGKVAQHLASVAATDANAYQGLLSELGKKKSASKGSGIQDEIGFAGNAPTRSSGSDKIFAACKENGIEPFSAEGINFIDAEFGRNARSEFVLENA